MLVIAAVVASATPAHAAPVPSEGVAASGAAAWHAAGIDGAGVTVAVIDGGFENLAAAQSRGELPASTSNADVCGGAFHTAGGHGTAVAEVVHDMAPGARLVLVCASNTVSALQAAKDIAVARGASIINYSAAFYNQSRGDGLGGPGTPDAIVADARARGVLWVAAAGNGADAHWSGPFAGDNGTYHQWVPGDTANAIAVGGGRLGCAYLRWDDWPASSQDFDLYLVDARGQIVSGRQGARPQTGTQPPVEAACVRNDGPMALFGIAIWRRAATRTPRMDVIVGSGVGPFEHAVAAGSIADPAASPDAFTVGAVCSAGNAPEAFSSRGPTLDGRTKPDISGHDSLSTMTFGRFAGCGIGFSGTSAAAPSVAGAAALVQQALPGRPPEATRAFLESRAIDLGAPGRDNTFGAGALALGAPPRGTLPAASALRRVRATCRGAGSAARRRVACSLRPHAAVATVAARLLRGARTVTVVAPRPCPLGRFEIRAGRRGLAAGRYRIVLTLRDDRGRRRTVIASARV